MGDTCSGSKSELGVLGVGGDNSKLGGSQLLDSNILVQEGGGGEAAIFCLSGNDVINS